jgi:hypothetical protein
LAEARRKVEACRCEQSQDAPKDCCLAVSAKQRRSRLQPPAFTAIRAETAPPTQTPTNHHLSSLRQDARTLQSHCCWLARVAAAAAWRPRPQLPRPSKVAPLVLPRVLQLCLQRHKRCIYTQRPRQRLTVFSTVNRKYKAGTRAGVRVISWLAHDACVCGQPKSPHLSDPGSCSCACSATSALPRGSLCVTEGAGFKATTMHLHQCQRSTDNSEISQHAHVTAQQ